MPGDATYLDPNDPNLSSQAPDPTSTMATANMGQDIQAFINDPRRTAWIQANAPSGQLTSSQMAQLAQTAKGWGYDWLPNVNADGTPNMVGSNAFAWKLLGAVAAVPLAVAGGSAVVNALGGATSGATTAGTTAGSTAATTAGSVLPSTTSATMASLPGVSSSLAGSVAPAVAGGGTVGTGILGGLTSPTASLIGTGVNALGSIFGAKTQANANEQASQLQAQTAQQALDWVKSQKAAQTTAWQPYQAIGQTALSNLPGLARQAPTQGPPAPYSTQPNATNPAPGYNPVTLSTIGQTATPPPSTTTSAGPSQPSNTTQSSAAAMSALPSVLSQAMPSGTASTGATGPMVLLEAPDGTRKSVPAAQAQFYVSKGAKVVG